MAYKNARKAKCRDGQVFGADVSLIPPIPPIFKIWYIKNKIIIFYQTPTRKTIFKHLTKIRHVKNKNNNNKKACLFQNE